MDCYPNFDRRQMKDVFSKSHSTRPSELTKYGEFWDVFQKNFPAGKIPIGPAAQILFVDRSTMFYLEITSTRPSEFTKYDEFWGAYQSDFPGEKRPVGPAAQILIGNERRMFSLTGFGAWPSMADLFCDKSIWRSPSFDGISYRSIFLSTSKVAVCFRSVQWKTSWGTIREP